MASGADPWLGGYDDAKQAANDILALIQDRNAQHANGSTEASKLTAQARRRLATLGTTIEKLADRIETADSVTENEKNRRRDLITALRSRRQQMLLSLKREAHPSQRAALLEGSRSAPARETAATAELDNRGLVQMQQSLMREQDSQVEQLEQTVNSTRHMALTIDEELSLHNRLLTELDEDVEVTHSRMRAAQKRVRQILRDSGGCKFSCAAFGLALILVVLIVLLFKIL